MDTLSAGNDAGFAAKPATRGGTLPPIRPAALRGEPPPPLYLSGCRGLVIVAPHPDDETVGPGATTAPPSPAPGVWTAGAWRSPADIDCTARQSLWGFRRRWRRWACPTVSRPGRRGTSPHRSARSSHAPHPKAPRGAVLSQPTRPTAAGAVPAPAPFLLQRLLAVGELVFTRRRGP